MCMIIYCMRMRYFNSQPHKEADVDGAITIAACFLFQLTASQGG